MRAERPMYRGAIVFSPRHRIGRKAQFLVVMCLVYLHEHGSRVRCPRAKGGKRTCRIVGCHRYFVSWRRRRTDVQLISPQQQKPASVNVPCLQCEGSQLRLHCLPYVNPHVDSFNPRKTHPSMAPPKTPRNKTFSDVHTPHSMAPTPGQPALEPGSAQPSEALAQVQEDEREVLKAIYMDDYEEAEATGSWGVCITVLPVVSCPARDFPCDRK